MKIQVNVLLQTITKTRSKWIVSFRCLLMMLPATQVKNYNMFQDELASWGWNQNIWFKKSIYSCFLQEQCSGTASVSPFCQWLAMSWSMFLFKAVWKPSARELLLVISKIRRADGRHQERAPRRMEWRCIKLDTWKFLKCKTHLWTSPHVPQVSSVYDSRSQKLLARLIDAYDELKFWNCLEVNLFFFILFWGKMMLHRWRNTGTVLSESDLSPQAFLVRRMSSVASSYSSNARMYAGAVLPCIVVASSHLHTDKSKSPWAFKRKGGDKLFPTRVCKERFNVPGFTGWIGRQLIFQVWAQSVTITWMNLYLIAILTLTMKKMSCHLQPLPRVALPKFINSGSAKMQVVTLAGSTLFN